MFEPCLSSIPPYTFFRSIRSSRGLVHAYVRDLGHPWVQGPYLPYKAILVLTSPFEAISMPQDDSKQCEHLLSQEKDPSWSNLAPLNLHSISLRSRGDLVQSQVAKNGNSGRGS